MLRRSLRGSVYEALLAMPLVYLNLPSNLVVAALLAEALRVPPDVYGLLVSLPFWCNLLQLFLAPALFRRWTARRVFLTNIWLNTLVWGSFAAVLAFAPGFVLARPGWVAGGFLFGVGMTAAVMAVSWTTYMQAWVPQEIRAVYFSRRNRWAQVSNLVFLLLAGFALKWPTLPVVAGIIACACVLRLASAVAAIRTPAPGEPVPKTKPDLGQQWRALREAPEFRRMVLFGAAWGAVLNGYGAFQPVFMLSQLTDSAQRASLPLALSMMFGALALPAWGRLLDRFGARPVLFCAVPLWALVNSPWAFMTRDTSFLLYAAWAFTGAINAGIVVAQLNLLMKLMPAGAKGVAVGVNLAATALGTALAPIAAGQILSWALARGWSPLAVYHGFFLTLPFCAALTLLVLRRVREPEAAPVEHVVGALRNFRMLAGALGLGFLAQTLFTPRGKEHRSEY